MAGVNPLTSQHCDTIDCVLQNLEVVRDLVTKCQNCGLDVSAAQEELNRQHALATKIKQQFFPDRP